MKAEMERHLLVLVIQVILFCGFYLGLIPGNSAEYGLYIIIVLAIFQLVMLVLKFKNNTKKWISVLLMIVSFVVSFLYYIALGLMSAYGS